jgi:hypothetical protein
MDQHQDDELIPDVRVARRYGVHLITLSRWTADSKLNFPAPIVINKRPAAAASSSCSSVHTWHANTGEPKENPAAPSKPAQRGR